MHIYIYMYVYTYSYIYSRTSIYSLRCVIYLAFSHLSDSGVRQIAISRHEDLVGVDGCYLAT